ncbi:MAG TPA: Ig-like domain-containing protein [Terracidiphilus sp.]|nr:Ig-like domain-containing protein [Terracidiphilus sp.]
MLTVTAAAVTLTSIGVSPASPSISAGATQQFTATATYSDGSTGNVTGSVIWASLKQSVATVSPTGLATGVGAGSTTITATMSGVTGSATLTVTAAAVTVTSIGVSPATPNISSGATQQFTATATYSDGSTANVTATATWASSNPAVATINSSGLATGASPGSATISATLSGKMGSAVLTVVSSTPKSIAVTPANPSFANGSTQQFTATATYGDGSTANVTSSVTWSSSNTAVATISSSGLATGQGSGTSTISAKMDGVTGSTTATVTVSGAVNIATWHVDNNRSGLNDKETILTPSNVSPTTFGKLFSCPVDGYVYGEPLILSKQTINGAVHNVLYVATENDSVYAYDADTCGGGTPLWKVSVLKAGETPLADEAILPYVGITSTPVIDTSTGTLYVVSTEESSAGGTFRLSALDIATGAEKFGGPVTINASVAATNSDSVNGVQTLDTSCLQRTALLLANGKIYVGFGGCHSGWLLAYNAKTLAQVGVFNASPNANGEGNFASAGGIWMGGAGPVADSSGNVYVTTGNGPWDGQSAWGDSVLKFGPTPVAGANGTMQPIDYFTPSVYQFMDCFDADLAAGGLLLVPGTTTLIAGGKTGALYLVNSSSLGHETSNDAGAIQEQVWGAGLTDGSTYQQSCQDSTGTNYANIASYEIFGSAAYFNGAVYVGVTPTSTNAPGGVRQFDYASSLSAQSDSSNFQNEGTHGTTAFISANGASDGIVWYINQGNPLQNALNAAPTSASLVAYDASNYPTLLYSSTANAADTPGYGIKFSSPVVANGKVYISTGTDLTTASNPRGEIDVYGLK